jgi:hypothetical protein
MDGLKLMTIHTHADPEVVITTLESFRCENLKKKKIDRFGIGI